MYKECNGVVRKCLDSGSADCTAVVANRVTGGENSLHLSVKGLSKGPGWRETVLPLHASSVVTQAQPANRLYS